MHEIRILSQGYGIPPYEAHSLRCMEGINQIITPPKWLLKKKKMVEDWNKKKKRKSLIDSFEDWLASVPQPNQRKKAKLSQREHPPQLKRKTYTNASQEFLNWLDDQL